MLLSYSLLLYGAFVALVRAVGHGYQRFMAQSDRIHSFNLALIVVLGLLSVGSLLVFLIRRNQGNVGVYGALFSLGFKSSGWRSAR